MPVSLQDLESHLVQIDAAMAALRSEVSAAHVHTLAAVEAAAAAAALATESFQAAVISSASAAASSAANTVLLGTSAVNIQALRTKVDSLVRVVAIDPGIVNH